MSLLKAVEENICSDCPGLGKCIEICRTVDDKIDEINTPVSDRCEFPNIFLCSECLINSSCKSLFKTV